MFVYIKCPCGRVLKAQRSPIATKIRCWDCHAEVNVPRYRDARQKPARREGPSFFEEWGDLVSGTVLLALLTLVAVAIPVVGGVLVLVSLTVAGVLYTRRIEEVGRGEAEVPDEADTPSPHRLSRWARTGRRVLLGMALAIGLTLPLWIGDGTASGLSRPKAWDFRLLLIVAPLLWITLPLLAYLLTAQGPTGRLGARRALWAISRRPWTALAAILLLPLTLLALEGVLFAMLALTGWLPAFVFDLYPDSMRGNLLYYGVKPMPDGTYSFSLDGYLRMYGDALHNGFLLIGSIPLSLSRGFSPQAAIQFYSSLTNESYLAARLAISLAELILVLGVLVVQASLFGRVARSAPAPAPTQATALAPIQATATPTAPIQVTAPARAPDNGQTVLPDRTPQST